MKVVEKKKSSRMWDMVPRFFKSVNILNDNIKQNKQSANKNKRKTGRYRTPYI